jgi:hypothetical protein
VGVAAMRRLVGHALGMLCSIVTISHAPRVMDAVVCALASLGLATVQGGCPAGSAGLGEGGLSFAWTMAPPLLGLLLIMEAALWLQRLYSAPISLPPIVAILGCPTLLAFLTGLDQGFPWFMWQIGLVMGLPVALAFTAYWFPLRSVMEEAPSKNATQADGAGTPERRTHAERRDEADGARDTKAATAPQR